MKIVVFGLGYVGFTAACCIAQSGHEIVGIDISRSKVRSINDGHSPIVEPKVQEMLQSGLKSKRIHASAEIGQSLVGADLAIVCVGTPSMPDGSHNMGYIADVSLQIAQVLSEMDGKLTVVYRSTMKPGTMEDLIRPIFDSALGKDAPRVTLVYNPEFLREGSAVSDYFNPPKIVVGSVDARPVHALDCLHAGINAPIFNVSFREAELTKFVDNSWHAIKVAFANEIGRVCLNSGISVNKIHEIFISDTVLNISSSYLRPGGAFGGSCLPKDVRALQHIGAEVGANLHLIDNLIRTNDAHKHALFGHAIKGLPQGARVLLVGLAFKADTDDLRESPNVDLARKLLAAGFDLNIYDPSVNANLLLGANLGYAYSRLPSLQKILVTQKVAEETQYDRIVVTNATVKRLAIADNLDVVNLGDLP